MGVAKVILNNQTLMDVTQKTVSANNLLSGYTALGADGENVTGTASAGGNEFVVSLSKNSETHYWEPDKTWAQIATAYSGGKTIVTICEDPINPTTVNGFWDNYGGNFIYYVCESLSGQEAVYQTYWLVSDDSISLEEDLDFIIPQGTLSVLQNGSFDVASYASVNVSVPSGGGSYRDLVYAMVQRTSYSLSIDSNLSLELSSTSIGAGAFMGQYGFSTITISGPRTIGMSAFAYAHTSAINVPDAEIILGSAFYKCDVVSLSLPKCSFLSGSYTFAGCSMLNYVAFPELLSMSIDGYHFTDCSHLNTVSMPKLTNVQKCAFFRCYGLTSISLPECISIYSSAFQMCKNLSDVYFPKCKHIYPYAFATSTTNAETFSSSAPRISQLTSSNFPELEHIYSSGFYYNTWITNISLSTLTSIYTDAFHNCGNLINLSIPNAVVIGASAFYKVGITTLSLPACNSIYSSAFRYCTSLQTVYISSAWAIRSYAFAQCSSLATVSIVGDADHGQLIIDTYTFNSCINLMSVYINATSLGSAAASLIFNLTPMKDSSYTGNFGSIYIQNESLYNQILSMSQWSTLLDRVVSAY